MWICDDLEDRLVAAAVRFLFILASFYVTSPRRDVSETAAPILFLPLVRISQRPLWGFTSYSRLPYYQLYYLVLMTAGSWMILFFVLKNYYYVACFYSRPRASIYKHCTLKLHTNKAKWERTYLSLSTICVVTDCFSFFLLLTTPM